MQTQWYLVFVAFASLAIHAFIDLSRGPLFPEILQSLSLNEKQGGLFFSATSLSMLASSFWASRLMRTYRSVVVLLWFMLFLISGQLLLSFANSLWSLLAAGVLLGLAFGGMGVAQNLAISEASSGSLQRRLYNGLHSMYALSAMLSPLLVGHAIQSGLGWQRFTMVLALLPSLLFLLLIGRFLLHDGEYRRQGLGDASSISAQTLPVWSLRALAAAGLGFYVVGELVVSLWLVLYLQKQHAFSSEQASQALSLFFALLLLGRVVSSFIDLRRSNYRLLFLCFVSNIVVLALGLWLSPWFWSLSGLSMSIVFPVYMSYMAEKFGDSLVYVMPYCIGGMSLLVSFAHSLAGYLGENYGLQYSMGLAFLGAILALLSLLSIEKKLPATAVASRP